MTEWIKMGSNKRGPENTKLKLMFVRGGLQINVSARNWLLERAPRVDVFRSQSGGQIGLKPNDKGMFSTKGSQWMMGQWHDYAGAVELAPDGDMLVATLPTRSLRERS